MPPTQDLSRQLRLLHGYAAFTYPFACVPFLYFWFRDHGLGIFAYSQLITAYYLTMVVAEVPTGVLADRFSRRWTMAVGPLVLAGGFAVIFAGRSFTAFCVGEALFGLGHSLLSGPPSALLYDSLIEHDRTTEFFRLEARLQALRLLGTGVAFLAGGVVVWAAGIGAAIALTGVLCAVAAVVSLGLYEPHRQRARALGIVRVAVGDLRQRPVIWLGSYYVLLFVLLRYCFHTYQPYLEVAGQEGPLLLAGLFFALNLAAAQASRVTPRALAAVGERRLLWSMPIMLGLALVAMAGTVGWVGIVLFFLHQAPFGMHWSVVQTATNHLVGSHSRATVLSMLSFLGRLAFAATFPLLGWLQEHHGLPATYLGVGLVGLALTVAVMALRPAGR